MITDRAPRIPGLRPIGIVYAVLGLVLLASVPAGLVVGLRADRVAELAGPEMTDEGLEQHREDYEAMAALFNSLADDVLPILATALGRTPEQLTLEIRANYPAVGDALLEREDLLELAETSLVNLENQQPNYEKANAISVSRGTMIMLGVLAGLAASVIVVAGVMAWREQTRRAGLVLATAGGVVGAILLVVPLALGVPGATAAAEELLDTLNPSDEEVVRIEQALETSRAATAEFDITFFPGLGAALGVSSRTLLQAIDSEFPRLTRALLELPDITERYEARADIRRESADDLQFLQRMPMAAMGWAGPLFGAVLLAVSGVTLLGIRGRSGRR